MGIGLRDLVTPISGGHRAMMHLLYRGIIIIEFKIDLDMILRLSAVIYFQTEEQRSSGKKKGRKLVEINAGS